MSMFAQKLLSLLLYPLTQTLLLFVIAIFLLLMNKRRLALFALCFGTLWLYLFSLPYVSFQLMHGLEAEYPAVSIKELPEAAAIVVLGGAISPALTQHGFFNLHAAADRPAHAARLYHLGKAPMIILSAGAPTRFEPEAISMSQFLAELGIPSQDVIQEKKSVSTFENAKYTSKILKKLKIKRIILVTSAWHMRRAKACFEAQGVAVIPAATDYSTLGKRRFGMMKWFPKDGALTKSTLAIKEIIGYWVYQYRGWIKA